MLCFRLPLKCSSRSRVERILAARHYGLSVQRGDAPHVSITATAEVGTLDAEIGKDYEDRFFLIEPARHKKARLLISSTLSGRETQRLSCSGCSHAVEGIKAGDTKSRASKICHEVLFL